MQCKVTTPLSARVVTRFAVTASIPVCCTFISCGRTTTPSVKPVENDSAPLRPVRVLAARSVEGVRLLVRRGAVVADEADSTLLRFSSDETVIAGVSSTGQIALGKRVWGVDSVTLIPGDGVPVSLSVQHGNGWSKPIRYPGRLQFVVAASGKLNVINHVDVEQYVACVVANEVWPTFAAEAYRAQAVIVRTYVLYQILRRRGAAWDIASTQGAQVYRGICDDKVGQQAAAAAEYTRGVVCTWNDQGKNSLFSTYYSSVCGGKSQSAAIYGNGDAVPPLAGGVKCDYCQIAPKGTYRWGPVSLRLEEVRRRLVARYPNLVSLGAIKSIDVLRSGSGGSRGRPVELRLTDSDGRTHGILAERFRLAIGADTMRSTDCDIRVAGTQLILEHGRGYGHGLGLCQWGMQGQALAGKLAGEILRYYYPTSSLTRVY
ncbi:MAG: SpoIID/LytB domain-containing protein [Phycisphaerae bacterium]